jgi:hypothetical protein
MSPIEGALYLGARNLFLVPWAEPLDFAQTTAAADHLREVGWSLEHGRVPGQLPESITTVDAELDYLAEQAARYPNFGRVIFDDFLRDGDGEVEVRPAFEGFTPQRLAECRERLHAGPRRLDLWMVLYAHQLRPQIAAHVHEFDGVSLWFWNERHVEDFERRYADFLALTPGQRRLVGCYLYNFAEGAPATDAVVTWQLDRLRAAIAAREIDGVILHTNAVADLGYPAVAAAKSWLAQHGDEEVSPAA